MMINHRCFRKGIYRNNDVSLTYAGVVAVGLTLLAATSQAAEPSDAGLAQELQKAEALFNQTCSACHGEGGAGGDRAPTLVDNTDLRMLTEKKIQDIIRSGTQAGMPAFPLPDSDLAMLAHLLHTRNSSAFDSQPIGNTAAGEQFFFGNGHCAGCHMVRGRGHSNGADLSAIGLKASIREIELVLDNPTERMGSRSTSNCPPWAFCPDTQWSVANVRLKDGFVLNGFARSEAEHDIQLQTFDGKMHFLVQKETPRLCRGGSRSLIALGKARRERI